MVVNRVANLVRARRARRLVRPESEWGDPALRAQIDALGPWFHNIDLRGTPTKIRSAVGEPLSYPQALWDAIAPHLPNLRGKTVLDIGANAGFFSLECKRLGADRVVGVDINQGTTGDFVAQARFAAAQLGVEIEYRHQDFRKIEDGPFDLVLFLGVLYHLDDPIQGLSAAARLARHALVVESFATAGHRPVVEFTPSGTYGDVTTRCIPSAGFIEHRLHEEGFRRINRLRAPTRKRWLGVAER